MMNETKLLIDSIDLIKKEGTITRHLKASIRESSILVPAGDFQIEAGDYVKRSGASDVVEMYEVLVPGFHELFHRIPARYQMSVRKLDANEASEVMGTLDGNGSAFSAGCPDRKALFAALSEIMGEEVKVSDLDSVEKHLVDEFIDAVREQAAMENPNLSVVQVLMKAFRVVRHM